MEALWVLLIPLAIAYLVAPIAAFFMALGNRKATNDLFLRIADLERKLALATGPGAVPPPAQTTQAAETRPPPERAEPRPAPEAPAAPAEPAGAQTIHVPPSPPPSAPPAAPPAPAYESFEQTVGTRWVVWVGGVALALGGIFLVSYAVEQGFVGPKVRLDACRVARRRARRRRRMGAPERAHRRLCRPAERARAEHSDRGRHVDRLRDGLRRLCALRIHRASSRLRSVRRSRDRHPGGGAAARTCPRGVSDLSERKSCLSWFRPIIRITGRSTSTSPSSPRQRSLLARARLWRWLALTAVIAGALWALPGIDETALDVSASACLPHRGRPCARRGPDRVRPVVRARRRAGSYRSGFVRRACCLSRRGRIVRRCDRPRQSRAYRLRGGDACVHCASRGGPMPRSASCQSQRRSPRW